jgi:hypothetical protein
VYLNNRTPTRVNNFKTPLQILSSHVRIPSILNLPPKIFGCVAYVHLQKPSRSKFEPRAEKCVFLGFGMHQKGYKCYNPNTRKFFTTMDIVFLESEYFFKGNNSIQEEIEYEFNYSQDLNFLRQPYQATDLIAPIQNLIIPEPCEGPKSIFDEQNLESSFHDAHTPQDPNP